MSTNTVLIALAGVVLVGGAWYWYSQQQAERDRQQALANATGLQGLGAGVDQSRQDVTEGLKFGSALAGIASQAIGFAREQAARDANTTRSTSGGGGSLMGKDSASTR